MEVKNSPFGPCDHFISSFFQTNFPQLHPTPCRFFHVELAVTRSESGSARLSKRHLELSGMSHSTKRDPDAALRKLGLMDVYSPRKKWA
jgi:hypothetical protein